MLRHEICQICGRWIAYGHVWSWTPEAHTERWCFVPWADLFHIKWLSHIMPHIIHICHTYVIHMSYICHTYVIYVIYICHMWLLLDSWNAVGLRQNCSLRCFPHGHHPDSPLHEGAEIHKGAAWIYIQSGLCRCFGKLMWDVHSLTDLRFLDSVRVQKSHCLSRFLRVLWIRLMCSFGTNAPKVKYIIRTEVLYPLEAMKIAQFRYLWKSLLAICAHCLRLPELFVECKWPGRVSN